MDNNDSRTEEVKVNLLEELGRRPNPNKKHLEEFLQRIREQHKKQANCKRNSQQSDEWTGMNESVGEVMTQTKIDVANGVMNDDDKAREVSENIMSAEVESCGTNNELTIMNNVDRVRYEREESESSIRAEGTTCKKNDEWTGMNKADIAEHESKVNDKAIRVVSQESEGQKEKGQKEQAVSSLWAEILPESLAH